MQSDLKALEFGGIQRLLEKLTSSVYGADAARAIEPAPEIGIALRMQKAVSAARRLIEATGLPNLRQIPDVRAALRQAQPSGAALAATALHHIRTTMQIIATLKPVVTTQPDLYPGAARDLDAPAELLSALERALQPSGYVRPDASVKLAELHAQAQRLREEINATLKTRLQDSVLREINNAERIVWHGNRGLLSVPASYSEKIKGVRRGTAANGRDQLVEPLEAVGLNNRIETLTGAQDQEQQAIRRALTDGVRAHNVQLQAMINALAWIDLALAGGQLSIHLNASEPVLVDAPRIELDRAYHPMMLLQFADGSGPQPVPLSIVLDAEQPMLVITGPNTGGKTVVLKTLGLLTTMAHCGLHVPADGTCTIGNFTRAIVGIGDAQNLYHHLSTFAGHVEVLKRLIGEADAGTLVLIDELGTGTDPEEGAALAMAVLDELSRRDVRGIVTTHLPPLKAYAERHPRMRNASMHFDQDALRPTYRLQIGESGKSLGLVIAGKNGLPPALIDAARAHLRAIAPERKES